MSGRPLRVGKERGHARPEVPAEQKAPGETRRAEEQRVRRLAPFAVFLLLSFAAAASGRWFEPGPWYAGLRKPAFTPPDWLFAPVWTVLYVCIGVSAALVWQRSRAGLALTVWGAQLLLNAAWSWIFFGLQRPGLAFIEIRLLWVAIALTILLFWQVRPLAGALLVPYLLWVSLATWLNWQLWKLNA